MQPTFDPTASLTTIATPDGPYQIVANSTHVLAAAWTEDVTAMLRGIHESLRPAPHQLTEHTGDPLRARQAVQAFYDGDPSLLRAVPVYQQSGPFRMQAWEAIRDIEAGDVASYAEVAQLAGRPTAVRAAASACSHCGVSLFIPCHRVVRADGSLGSFGSYGERMKLRLLRLEGCTYEFPGMTGQ